jgi:predicted transcriptional regulator
MKTQSIKEQAYRLLDNLPDTATWDDVMYRIYVRQAIESGLKDSDKGRTLDVKEVRKRFGLPT